MRIGILTLHRAFNYGAYLQAYAMAKYLKQRGHDPMFVEVGGLPAYKKRMRTLVTKSPGKLVFNYRKYRVFKDAWKKLKTGGRAADHFDAIVVGSDELWSVTNVTFHCAPEFFGVGLRADRLIAYAPSVGQSRPSDLAAKEYVVEGLRKFSHLSARDQATVNSVREITGAAPVRVLDPTFLVDWTKEGVVEIPPEDTLLIYSYTFNSEKIAIARQFAKAHGLKIISPGFFNSWCDDIAAISPLHFLDVMRSAKYVLTDTFHGTIFSVLLKKNFAVMSSGKLKIESLLRDLNLEGRDVCDYETLCKVMEAAPDFDAMETEIFELKKMSFDFIERALAFDQ